MVLPGVANRPESASSAISMTKGNSLPWLRPIKTRPNSTANIRQPLEVENNSTSCGAIYQPDLGNSSEFLLRQTENQSAPMNRLWGFEGHGFTWLKDRKSTRLNSSHV